MKSGSSPTVSAIVLCLLVLTAGCGTSPPADTTQNNRPSDSGEAAPEGDPVKILTEMVQAYQKAPAYSDQAIVSIRYRLRGEISHQEQPLSVVFVRPGKLVLNAYDVRAASNAANMQVQIGGSAAEELDGQFVNKPAPASLAWPDLGLDEPTHEIIEQGLARHPPQLELLLADDPLEQVFGDDMKKEMLPPEEIDGRQCRRIRALLSDRDESFVFWVDAKNHILRRLEFPESFVPQVASLQGVAGIELKADFKNAAFLEPIDQSYQLQAPEDATIVESFLFRPPELATKHIGEQPKPFEFSRLYKSAPVELSEMAGKVTALVWFNNIPAGELAMKRLNAVAENLSDADKFAFYGVCVEPPDRSNAEISALMSKWKVTVPVVRDLKAFGRDSFDIPAWPTLVVLGADGSIQIFEPGNFEKMEQQLPDLMTRIANGEDLAAMQREVVAEKKAAYAAHLKGAPEPGENEVVMKIPTIKVLPAKAPDLFVLKERWSSDKFKAPGKFVATATDAGIRLFALDGYRTIVELDSAGKEVMRKELPLPEGVAVSELRMTTTAAGELRFAAFEILGRQAHIFDESWKLLFSYPDIKQDHQGIRDVLLADLDAEKDAEAYIGFWFPVGIHQVNMRGELQTADKQLTSVLSLAQTPPNSLDWRKLIAAGAEGYMLRYNQFLKSDPQIRMKDVPLHQVAVAETANEGVEEYLGLSFETETEIRVIAFDQKLEEHWSFNTPLLPRPPIAQSLQTVGKDGAARRWWLVALADGSISVVQYDASSDYFRLGEEILHAQVVESQGANLLLISTPKRIFATELATPN